MKRSTKWRGASSYPRMESARTMISASASIVGSRRASSNASLEAKW